MSGKGVGVKMAPFCSQTTSLDWLKMEKIMRNRLKACVLLPAGKKRHLVHNLLPIAKGRKTTAGHRLKRMHTHLLLVEGDSMQPLNLLGGAGLKVA